LPAIPTASRATGAPAVICRDSATRGCPPYGPDHASTPVASRTSHRANALPPQQPDGEQHDGIIRTMTMYDIAAPFEISKYCQVVRKM